MPRFLFSQPTITRGIKVSTELEGDPVTPSDAVDLPNGHCICLAVTGAGNVSVNLAGGGTAVLTGLTAGQIVRVACTRVLATSTTATGIFALYPADNVG